MPTAPPGSTPAAGAASAPGAAGEAHGLSSADFGEVLDRHLLAVHLQAEVLGAEVGHPVAAPSVTTTSTLTTRTSIESP